MNGLFHAALYGIVISILLKFAKFFCQFREILVRNCLLIEVQNLLLDGFGVSKKGLYQLRIESQEAQFFEAAD